nr:hypothetical protein [Tanacetum cinerariifolium]
TMSALKLPMLKTRYYDLWSMRMEQYLTHTDYALWEAIMNGDAPASIASISGGAEATIPPKTTEQKIARKNELKAKSTMLLAIPDEHLLKFHRIKDVKTLWLTHSHSETLVKKNTISTQDLIVKEKMESQSVTIQTMSALKLPMLKTRYYDLWSMRMEQYLTHTDYALWEAIMNGDAPASIASISGGAEATIPPKTTEQKIARKNELKAKSTMLLAIPDEHLLKFHRIKDVKTL